MLLQKKNAVIYGGGGAIGGAVARAFAREGAKVFLAGRTLARLEKVAREISAEIAQVDALDEAAVERHADAVAAKAGGIDIMLNAVGILHVQGTPFAELSFQDYAHPIAAYTRTNFLTAKAVARHMVKRGSGVILRPDAIPEALATSHAREVFSGFAERAGISVEAMLAERARTGTLLKRFPTLAEVADFAAFAASDRASAMTGAIANLTCGSLVD
jgi:3-oxoacyl-[acyl-carrier protein] reductase